MVGGKKEEITYEGLIKFVENFCTRSENQMKFATGKCFYIFFCNHSKSIKSILAS